MQKWKNWNGLKMTGILNGRWAQCHECNMGVATLTFIFLSLLINDFQ